MKKKKFPKEPDRYQILDVIHESYAEFVIFDSDDTEVAKGSIKWDNCSNWEIYESHFCGLEEMKEFHKVMERCYEIAKLYSCRCR